MRYVYSVAALAAFSFLAPSQASAQGLSVTNYRLISTERVNSTQSFHTLAADLVNTGAARSVVTATVTSPVANLQVLVGEQNLHFSPVPAGSQVPSLDTFRILVDTNVAINYSQLQWTFNAPFANAGPNQTVPVGRTVTLNGSASSTPAGGGILQYNWTFLSRPPGSSVRISNASEVLASFVPDVIGSSWIIRLTVTNNFGTDVSIMTVTTGNSAPVANAGPNQTVLPGALVTLNGSASNDADGDPLTYLWTLTSRPVGSSAALANPTSVTPTFVADRAGSYTARLIVNDGQGHNSLASNVTITTQNTAPVANAGPAQSVSVGALVQLSGSLSTDVDGNPLTYLWSLTAKPAGSVATLSSTTPVMPTFTVDLAGTYVAQLIVNDGTVNSLPATVTITTGGSQTPSANAGPNQTVKHHSLVQLNGSGTDPQSRPLTYSWSFSSKPAGSTAAFANAAVSNPAFTADLLGNYVAQLIVNNGLENSLPSTVTITTTNTAPVANAGASQTAAVAAVVSLNGTFSSDADGDALTFAWTFSSRPPGSTATLQAASSSSPTFVPDLAGTYVVQLIVSDVFASSVPVTVTITAISNGITLTPDPLALFANAPGTMTLTLSAPALSGGQVINLSSLTPSVATVPLTVTVPPNSTTATFLVTPQGPAGSSQISASALGYRPGSATVNVGTPTIGVSLSAATVGLTRTINGTVTLSAAAPAPGVSVNVNASPGGIVTITGSPVFVATGATTGTFTVTGATIGAATVTASAPGYGSGSTSVTSSLLGQITVEKNVTVAPGETKPLQVSLASPAPSGGAIITLISSNNSAVVVTNTVTIPAGSTAAAVPATITGVSFGSSTISATAAGFTGDSSLVVVGSALSFTPSAISLGSGATQNLTLMLSGPSPSNMTVNLNSSNSSAATVPSSVIILQNATTVLVPVTGGSAGSSTITATAAIANVIGTTANVTVSNVGSIQMPASASVALGQSISLQVSLSAVAPSGGVTVNLLSSSARAALSVNSVFIAAGLATPAVQPTVTGVSPGSATISALATGFSAASQSIAVTASFSLSPATLAFPSGASQNLQLTLSGPAPAGGLSVTLGSNNTNVATVPATILIAGGATTAQVPVAGLVPGSAVITASATGVTSASSSITIQNSGAILVSSVTVAPGQTASLNVSLPAPAVTNTTIALSSSDTSKATVPATVTVLTGQTQPSIPPSLSGVNFGSATITATAAGYGTGTGLATIGATMSFVQQNVTVNAGISQSMQLTLSVIAPPGGLPVALTSSNPAVLLLPSNITISQNSGGVNFLITGLTPGSTVITATTSVPNVLPATVTVTVPGAGGATGTIALPVGSSVTAGQSMAFPVTLSAAAPVGGTVVALSSSDTSKLTISPASVTVLQGQTQPASQPQVTGAAVGSASISASATGYTSATQTVQVNSGGTISLTPATLSMLLNSSQNLTVTLPSAALAGGKIVNLSSSDTTVATVPPTVTVLQGATTAQVPVSSLVAGATTITASALGQGQATSAITVSAAIGINLPANLVVGPGQTKPFTVTLATAAAVATTVTLSSADDSKLTISPQTIFFNAGQTAPTSQPNVTGVAEGTVAISASGSGLTTASTNVRVGYSLTFTPGTLAITGTAVQNLTLTLNTATPVNLTVNVSSGNTAVATAGATAFFAAGATTATVPVTGVTPGSSVISASTATIPVTTATVNVSGANIINVPALTLVSLGKSVAFPITLSSAAPQNGIIVTLTSADITKVIVPATVFIAAGQFQPTTQPTVLGENVGNVNVTATAPGYTSGTGLVKVGTTVAWNTPTVEIAQNTSQVVFLAMGASAPGQPPFPGDTGVLINFVSSNPNVVSIRENVTAYPDGSEFTTIAVVITSHGPGTVVITASGLNIPVASMTVNVSGPLAINTTSLPNGAVGTAYSQTLSGGGGTLPRSWSLTSGTLPAGLTLNSATGVISGTPTAAVANTPLTFRLTDGSASPQSVTVSLTLTIVAGGGGGGGTMTLTPSPLPITGTATQNLTLALSAPAPVGGLIVNLTSSITTTATVPSSVTVPASSSTVIVPVTGVAAGSSIVTAVGTGYGQATANITVTGAPSGDIILAQNLIVAPGDFTQFPVTLAVPAAQATFVLLSVTDTATATLSQQNIFINPGQTTPTLQPRINGIATGTTTVTATASGLATATTNVRVGFGLAFTPQNVNITGTANQNVTLSLTSATPSPLVVALNSSNPNIATVPATVTIFAGNTTANVVVTGVTPGSVVITATASGIPDATANVTIAPPGMINLQPVSLPLGQTAPLPVTLTTPAPFGGLIVSLHSSNTSRVTVPATVTIAAGQTAPSSPVMVTGVNTGPSTITATAPLFTTGSAEVNVNATVTWLTTDPIINVGQQQILQLKLSASAPWPIDGGVAVTLVSSNPAIASVQQTVSFFPDGSEFTTLAIVVTGGTAGTAAITAQGLNIPAAVVTVTVVGPVSVVTTALPTGSVGLNYSHALAGTGGRTPYTWSLTGGTLPGGLALNPATGVIAGIPTAAAINTPLTFQVTDASNPAQTGSGAVTLTVIAQVPDSVIVNGGGSQSTAVNTAFGSVLSVLVKDANGVAVPGITVQFAVPASGASAAFAGGVTTAITGANGIASSAVLTANSALGSYTATGNVGGVAVPASFGLTNISGPAANVAATSGTPQHTSTNTVFGSVLTVTVTDSGGNPVNGALVTFAVPGSGASGSFAGGANTATTGPTGVASSALFTANGNLGTYAVTALVSGAAGPATFNLTNTSGPVTSVSPTTGTPQSAAIGVNFTLPLSVVVRDGASNPVPGVTVTFAPPVSGASGTFFGGVNTAVSNGSGIATSPIFKANSTLGGYNVAATVAGVATPANFALTNTPGAPASVTVVSGTPQNVSQGSPFAPLVVLVRDAASNPIPGLTVTFTAPNAGASGTFAAFNNTAVTNGSGVATSAVFTANAVSGTYQVTATTAALPAATFTLTNNVPAGPQVSIPNVQVGRNLQVLITVAIPNPAPAGGQRITLTPSNYSLVRVAGRQGDAGLASPLQVTIGEGLTQATGIYVQALGSSGTAQIVASTPGLGDGISTVVLSPSGVVISGPNGAGGSFQMFQGGSATLTVQSARLTADNTFAEVQAVKGGVVLVFDPQTGMFTPGPNTMVPVALTNSTPAVGTVNPVSVTIVGGESSATATFTSSSSGSSTVTAGVPAGYTLPTGGANAVAINVVPSGLVAANTTVGQNLQTAIRVTLNSPAPVGGLPLTIASSDSSKVLFSSSATAVGLASITLNVQAGRNNSQDFFVQGLQSGGAVNYTATGPGYGTAGGTITLTPSGFVIMSPFGRGADFFTTTGAQNSDLSVVAARLDASLNFIETQPIRGGFSVSVGVTSGNTAVGTITASPLSITGPNNTGNTQFDPSTAGVSLISAVQPSGFNTPSGGASVNATVRLPQISVNTVTVGKNLQTIGTLLLGQPAPLGGTQVTLTSNSAQLLLSGSQTVAGTNQLVITVPQNQSSAFFVVQGFADSGTATYSVTSPGYVSTSGNVTHAPSGIIISSLFGAGQPLTTTLNGGSQPITASTALLDSSTAFVATQPLAAGLSLSVSMSSDTTSVGTVPATATITGGSSDATVQFTPASVGNTVLRVTQPAGYTLPSQFTALLARVNP